MPGLAGVATTKHCSLRGLYRLFCFDFVWVSEMCHKKPCCWLVAAAKKHLIMLLPPILRKHPTASLWCLRGAFARLQTEKTLAALSVLGLAQHRLV
jgi:hypothetical protein